MPSSFGHAAAGYALMRGAGGRLRRDWMALVAATAPDLDILAGLLTKGPIDYSNRRSHSIGAALAAGLVTGGWARLAGRQFVPGALLGTAAYASHLVLDYLGKEADDGLPLLWPFSASRMSSAHRAFGTADTRRNRFFRGLISHRNLRRVGRELAILSPVVLAGVGGGRIIESRKSGRL